MAAPNNHAASISEAEADIEQTRDDLGRTVDALKDKFDVKESAAAQVHNVQEHAAHVAAAVVLVWLWRRR